MKTKTLNIPFMPIDSDDSRIMILRSPVVGERQRKQVHGASIVALFRANDGRYEILKSLWMQRSPKKKGKWIVQEYYLRHMIAETKRLQELQEGLELPPCLKDAPAPTLDAIIDQCRNMEITGGHAESFAIRRLADLVVELAKRVKEIDERPAPSRDWNP